MNNMQIFNNADFGQIRTLKEQSNILFCASDIAKALGYAKPNNAVAKYCRATLKRGIPLAGKIQEINFISESDVYRLIVKSKLPAAEKFECWVFDEVLPTIRKTGSYQIKPQPDYKYQPKTYKGQPVVTLQDLAHFSNRDTWMIRYQVKRNLKENTDYAVLQGRNLAAFKAENGKSAWLFASCLTVIFKSGFLKLTKLIADLPKQLECFKAQLPQRVSKRRITTNMPDVKEAQRLSTEIKKRLASIDCLLQLFMRYNEPDKQTSFTQTLEQLGWAVASDCCELKRVQYELIEEPY